MMAKKITIATCQFPVSGDIKKNKSYILKQIAQAKRKNADLVHFPECCLSGYADYDFHSFKNCDENQLKLAFENILKTAAELKIWIIIGSHHFEKNQSEPYNSLWIINDEGKIKGRYDKRLLTGKPDEMDHLFYQAGSEKLIFKIKNIKCGLLICHEWRYPELYREYKNSGCEIIFQSWYDGNLSASIYKKEGINLGTLVPGTVRGNAANNCLWISASNTSTRESSFASFVVRPDGGVVNKLKRNTTGILLTKINLNDKFDDPSQYGRKIIKMIS